MSSTLFEVLNPDFSLKKVKAVVFDLDDTLYAVPSGAQFRSYGENLSLYLPEGERSAYLKELERSWHDGSPIKVGRAFDPLTGWVLVFDDQWRVKSAYRMDGKTITKEEFRDKYAGEACADDLPGLIHLSSGWGIPSALARLRGLGRKEFRAAYLATRKEMREHPENFPFHVARDLPPFLQRLHGTGTVLVVMTNSDLGDAEEVLTKLGIAENFDRIYAEARKPTHALPIFKEMLGTFQLEAEALLVVGDSVYNDLREAKSLGGQTVLIERFPGQPLGGVDARVWDFHGFIAIWDSSTRDQ